MQFAKDAYMLYKFQFHLHIRLAFVVLKAYIDNMYISLDEDKDIY